MTETKEHPIDACTHCGGTLSQQSTSTYFEEDRALPQKKIVIKHTVEKGYCAACKRWSAGVPLPDATVILGGNVTRYVTYLSVCARQSYAQIRDLLKQTYNFDLSDGEIAKILAQEGVHLRPQYERLKARIRRESSVHLDETGWDLVQEDGSQHYAWTMVGGESREAVFVLGKTRVKGIAADLLGNSDATVVSDDYAAYRDRDKHQLCCAHPNRKLRDLARSEELTEAMRERCVVAYRAFASIYADIEATRKSIDPASRYREMLTRLYSFSAASSADCAKLARFKKQVANRATNYLTYLLYPCAADNNAAERSLRHLVQKRKVSFGSFSEKTADTLAVLLSVLMSYKQRGTLRKYW